MREWEIKWKKNWNEIRDCVIKIIEQKIMRKNSTSWMQRKNCEKFPIGLELFFCFYSRFFYVCVCECECLSSFDFRTGTRNAKLVFLFVFWCHWKEIDSLDSFAFPEHLDTGTRQFNKLIGMFSFLLTITEHNHCSMYKIVEEMRFQ